MKTLFLVNEIEAIKAIQSTAGLIHAATERGWPVWVAAARSLRVDAGGRVLATAQRTTAGLDVPRLLAELPKAPSESIVLDGAVRVLTRINPARSTVRGLFDDVLRVLSMAERHGARVRNPSHVLRSLGVKVHLMDLPLSVRPRSEIAAEPGPLIDFVRAAPGAVILKPCSGTGGKDVFKVDKHDQNLRQIAEVVLREGFGMAQDYMPEGHAGDVRVLVLNGEPLRYEGQVVGVRRSPPPGDFRSNVGRGGVPSFFTLDAVQTRTAVEAGTWLGDHDVAIAGLDLVGDRIVEVNVHAPGGFDDLNRYCDHNFYPEVLDGLA